MQVIDLFSGIGGFSLAARWAGWETVQFCEINEYCQAVLRKNFPGVPIHNDVKTLNLETIKKGGYDPGKPSILVGGFPCQPYSTAGERRGNDDDRALWPEVIRILREVRPTWFVGENVDGLVSMDGGRVLEGILLDLEGAGYSWEVYAIPACGVGAPHRRYRVWIIAHNDRCGGEGSELREPDVCSGCDKVDRFASDPKSRRWGVWPSENRGACEGEINAPCDEVDVRPSSNNARAGLEGVSIGRGIDEKGRQEQDGYGSECDSALSHSKREGLEGRERVHKSACFAKSNWSEHWLEVAARLCGTFNGLSRELDKDINNEKKSFASGQDLPCLWHHFQQEAFRVEIRGRYTVFEPEVLFAVLWKHFRKSEGSDNLLFESEEVQGAFLRNVWEVRKSGCSPQRWEYQEQYAIEHSNALSQLSHDIALEGLESKKAFNKNRKSRLEALGNAIVPQVVYEIFIAINEYEKTSPRLHP